MRIRTFILAASAVVSVIFVGGGYFAVGHVFDRIVRDSARQSSNTLAKVTFSSMYQVMSTGWKRAKVEAFLKAMHEATQAQPTVIHIYRGAPVIQRYGEIEQPPIDALVARALASGIPAEQDEGMTVRRVQPLVAEERCLNCHENAAVGDVMGAIEVSQDLGPVVAQARREFMLTLLLLMPFGLAVAAVVVWRVNRRVEQSITVVGESVRQVNAVADLKRLEFKRHDLGFTELNELFGRLEELVRKLQNISIDKDILKFEIGLLEKFVITSDVVKDWHDYILQLLVDINRIMVTHTLFSVFRIDEEQLDLEVFWINPPSQATLKMMERHVNSLMEEHTHLGALGAVNLHHHIARPGAATIELDEDEVRLRVKSFLVDTPKIGGIVGIGVHSEVLEDETLHLVMDSVLSTLLNVVGSVKAIYKYTKDLEYYATRDPLTDLFNQRVFWELLGYEVVRAQRHEYPFSLLVIDLDNFKLVNDSYGHAFGDQYLQAFSRATREVLRGGDILARYGGDEFVVVLPQTDLAQANQTAQRILGAAEQISLEAPDGSTLKGTISIGLATFPIHANEAKDLFLFADNMLYKAKSEGKRRIGVPSEKDVMEVFRDISQRSVLVLNALENRQIVPFFQPILDVKNGRITACEVLSRIESEGRFLPGAAFIELAEKMGVIHQLDRQVTERALAELKDAGFDGQVFINLSPKALVLKDFTRSMSRLVADQGFDPGRIVFEITERDTVKNLALLERLLLDLKSQGFKLAIDDFGSGFSSFHYLRRFPIDILKVEGDFIVNMLDSPKDRAFVHTMKDLAAQLGIEVLAEFVENQAVLDEVRRIGIDYAQGYHVGRPARRMPANLR
ncbi:MAG: EAL domain-containing protein [Rhodocyclaceae bacterium]|jgi:diguanylate cyclase (GGDEF)-like protein|nr:EAL domain-containing protein [Rhodocyclaceae bacterium]